MLVVLDNITDWDLTAATHFKTSLQIYEYSSTAQKVKSYTFMTAWIIMDYSLTLRPKMVCYKNVRACVGCVVILQVLEMKDDRHPWILRIPDAKTEHSILY